MKTPDKITLDSFLTIISLGVIFSTEEGIITKTNPYVNQAFGYTDLQGMLLTKIIPSFFEEINICDSINGKKSKSNIQVPALAKNGHLFLVDVTLDYFEDNLIILIKVIPTEKQLEEPAKKIDEESFTFAQQEETLTKLISVTREKDIKLKKANIFLKNIWNYAEIIIFVTDNRGIIKMFNPNAEEKLGYTAQELIDNKSSLLFFLQQELLERKNKLAIDFNQDITEELSILTLPTDLGLPNEFEATLVKKDQTSFPVLITLNKMGRLNTDSSIDGYIGIARDISEKKKAEIELINTLEREKELSDLRFRLLSLASHEFKTPLNVILFSTSIIAKYNKTEDQPKREKHLQRITNCVKNLNDLLNDLLSISKLEKGEFQIKKIHFKPKEHIKEIIEEIGVLLKKGQNITYKHIGTNLVYLDASILKHIIVNLLTNAIKYSPEFSKISIQSKNTGNRFIFWIKDNGYGVSKEEQVNLFNRFTRGSNVSHIEGSGLGLFIINNFLENMDGELDFDSKLNVGTKVKLTLKLDDGISGPSLDIPVLTKAL